jgi:hypothetical protein
MPPPVSQFPYAMKRLFLVITTIALLVGPLAAEDSPLVAAAKKTNRLKKKPGIVINDETLKAMKDGGHVTTTQIVYAPPRLLPSAKVVEGATVYKKPAPKKAEEAKPQRPRGDDAEGYLEEDEGPPQATSTAAPETPKAAPTPQAKKP